MPTTIPCKLLRTGTTVWAADHVQPDRPIDGVYPYAISVRDLASQYQLTWEPVSDVGAESTIAVLASLFWEHGTRLVFKTDNGSAFIAGETGELLAAWGILHLRRPAATPQYNGSCGGKRGTGTFCAKHPPGLSGKMYLSPFSRRGLRDPSRVTPINRIASRTTR